MHAATLNPTLIQLRTLGCDGAFLPTCATPHRAFLANKKEVATVAAAATKASAVSEQRPKSAPALRAADPATFEATGEASKHKRRRTRAKKKAKAPEGAAGEQSPVTAAAETSPLANAQAEQAAQSPASEEVKPSTSRREPEQSSSKGSLFEQFCYSLRHLPPDVQEKLIRVWKETARVSSNNSSD